ncbi:MAG: hypothetical protein QF519_06425, partial [Candidatus Poseidoniia archaeon]|nr:hypothetical protein [Candidatus Poseidoniia archaeon]
MRRSPVGVDAATGIAHFRGVPVVFNETTGAPSPVQIPRGTVYAYVEMVDEAPNYSNIIKPQDPLPESMIYPTGIWNLIDSYDVLMDYTEDVYFNPYTGTVQNQVYNVTGYVDLDKSGNLTAADTVVQMLNVEYSDEQQAAYPASMGQKAFAQYYSGNDIPVMLLRGNYTEAEVTESVDTATERTSNLKMADTYVPGTLIVLALGCLIGGFY